MTTCRNGHERTEANGYFKANGYWTCRVCVRQRQRANYDASYRSQSPLSHIVRKSAKEANASRP